MEVFRISTAAYSKTLSSSGSANRWNLKGQFVLYTGSSRSLSSLELVVHKGAVRPAFEYQVMVISLADDDHLVKQVKSRGLPYNWRTMAAYPQLQRIGAAWYDSRESLVLKVPSAIIPMEFNYVINTEHPEFGKKVKLVRTEDYFWDSRLL
ncbi:MAG: RES family NAD+ phosphorylase [Flavihumibacter sp.]